MKTEKLTANDWLEAAFRALTNGGPSAIKAEAIARDLGVSKGSFYWHFANVPVLKSSMLSHWQKQATQTIIRELEQNSATPKAKLQQLMSISTSGVDVPYGGPLVEMAIRDWARYEKSVGKVIHRVDTARIKFVESLLQQYGADKNHSQLYARMLYSSLIGGQILSVQKLGNPKKELSELLTILLDRVDFSLED